MNVLDLIDILETFPENSDVLLSVNVDGDDMDCLVGRVIDRGGGFIEISPLCGSDRGLQFVGVENDLLRQKRPA